MRKLKLSVGRIDIHAELLETPTAAALCAAAPFEARVAVWGNEIYFPAPVSVDLEPQSREVVDPGELAYRVEGGAVVIGWGPTPVSEGDEIRLAARGNVWGRTADDLRRLAEVEAGTVIRVEVVE